MKIERINYLFIIGISVISSLILYSLLPGKRDIWMFVNSDTLYLPSLYLDLFVHKTGIQGWHLNAAPNFFPDMLLYFPIMAIFKHVALASLVLGTVQQSIVLILVVKFFRVLDPTIKRNTLYLICLSFLILPFSSILGDSNLIPSQLLMPAYHCGFFINSLLAAIFAFKYLEKGYYRYLGLALLVTFLAVISDKLFIVGFAGPVILFSVINLIRKRGNLRYLVLPASVIATIILGLIVFNLIRHTEAISIISTDWKMFQFDNIGSSLVNLINHLKSVIIEFPMQRWLIIFTILFMIGAPIYLLVHIRVLIPKSEEKPLMIHYNLILYILFFVVIVLFTPVINGSYVGQAIIRYNYAALIMGASGFVYLLVLLLQGRVKSAFIQNYFTSLFTIGLIILLATIGIKNHSAKGLQSFANYYPPSSEILDSLQSEYGLTYGISEYWQAKYTTVFSRENVRLYTVFDGSFHPWYHVTNEYWYHDGGKGQFADPTFNYLVVDKFKDTGKLETIFGNQRDTIYNKEITVIKVPDYKISRETREIYLTGS